MSGVAGHKGLPDKKIVFAEAQVSQFYFYGVTF